MKTHTLIFMCCIAITLHGLAQSPSQEIKAYQYFIDTDPGIGIAGNGAIVSGTFGADLMQSLQIALPSGLTEGFHQFYLRTEDEDGNWSIAERRPFAIVGNHTQNVTALQYFFDTDPGTGIPGNGGIIEVGPGADVSEQILIPVPVDLSTDFHKLFIRTRDENGRWSFAEQKSVPIGTCVATSADGMLAWWSFEETDGQFEDNTGANVGVAANGTTGGGDAHFDGTDDYVAIPDQDDLGFGQQNFTIEFLANFEAPGGDVGHPGDKFIGQSEGGGDAKKWTFALGGGELFFRVSDGTTSSNYVQSAFAPVLSQWYHLALTREGDVMRTYVNGVQAAQSTVAGFQMPEVNGPLTIGYVDWVQGGDQGFMKGRLDEMTVYNRALSQGEIQSIFNAGYVGKCKSLLITTPVISDAQFGESFSQTLQSKFGIPVLTWTLSAGALPGGLALSSGGVLSGTPDEAGDFSFTIMVEDDGGAMAQRDYTMSVSLSLPVPEFTIFKSGTAVVPGREIDYFMVVENTGSVAGTAYVFEFLDPWFTYISSEPMAEVIAEMPDYYAGNLESIIPSNLKWETLLEAGEKTIIPYRVKLNSTFPIGSPTIGASLVSGKQDWELCFVGPNNQQQADNAACEEQFGAPFESNQQLLDYGECLTDANDKRKQNIKDCYCNLLANCDDGDDDNPSTAPLDPNEKLVLAGHYIQPGALLPYVIHFENIGTIEALDVFIKDTLDINLDENSLNIISSEGASFDPLTRELKWDLYNINLLPDSSGYVMYTARPKPDLPSGTVIKNDAAIQFEVFDIFMTNETENIIDGIAPEGVMDALPAEVNFADFLISWSGTDAVGEIKSYSIFVSQDGGPYSLYLSTEDTSATFVGVNGSTYSFTCIAEDLAGNVEVQEPIAEATTFINATLNTYFEDSDDDGFGNAAISVQSYTSSVDGYSSDNTDCNDTDALEHPGQLWHEDLDDDGYGSGIFVIQCARPSGSFVIEELLEAATDCDDGNAAIHPGAEDICNQNDDDCDTIIDEDAFVSDFNHDGYVNVGDLLMFSSSFGCTSNCGFTDMNSDGVVNVSDLLIFSSQFGSVCP